MRERDWREKGGGKRNWKVTVASAPFYTDETDKEQIKIIYINEEK